MNSKTFTTVVVAMIIVFVGVLAGVALATPYVLTVDGATYAPYKVVGGGNTAHYNTPDTNPSSAFSERHVWTGNGSENLPCEDGIHWIDNKNVLTISHCLEGETPPTTTLPPSTTTTTVVTTTTVSPPTTTVPPTSTTLVTTTTLNPTTTTTPQSTTIVTTTVPNETTTIPEVVTDIPELPVTGAPLRLLAILGVMFTVLGVAAVRAGRG